MKEHSNKIWWKTSNDWYSISRVVSETRFGGYNFAMIEKFVKSTGCTNYNVLVDLSKYRMCWKKSFYSSKEVSIEFILGLEVFLSCLNKKVRFHMRNASPSPSPWDSGFGQAYYIESTIYTKPQSKIDSMRDAIKTGVTFETIGRYIDDIASDVVKKMSPLIDCLEKSGEPILTPENDFYF